MAILFKLTVRSHQQYGKGHWRTGTTYKLPEEEVKSCSCSKLRYELPSLSRRSTSRPFCRWQVPCTHRADVSSPEDKRDNLKRHVQVENLSSLSLTSSGVWEFQTQPKITPDSRKNCYGLMKTYRFKSI